MKYLLHIILSLLFISIHNVAISQAPPPLPKSEVTKGSYIEKCKKEFRTKLKDVKVSNADLQEFCECNADKLFSKFTVDEIRRMDQIMSSGNDEQKRMVNEKIQPVVMPCFADFQTKIK